MSPQDYKEMMEDIFELSNQYVVIWGYGDIVSDESGNKTFKEFDSKNYWSVMNRFSDKILIELLKESYMDVDRDGEYEFKAILKYYPGEYDEFGRCTTSDNLEIEYIDWNFVQTFEERERESKLQKILDFDNLFEI